jgi:hypothetical protein
MLVNTRIKNRNKILFLQDFCYMNHKKNIEKYY